MAGIKQLRIATISQFIDAAIFLIKIVFWIVCFVFGFLCLIPTAYLSSGLFDWWDKAQHVFAFFCLSSLGILAYQKAIGKVVVGLIVYGGLIEILQWLTEWRFGELADWLADVIGILFGSIFVNMLIQNRSRLLRSKR